MSDHQKTGIVIAEVAKNSRETIRLTADVYKGVRLLQLRSWVANRTGEMIPTKSGIAIKVELIPELLAGLEQARVRLLSSEEQAA